MKMEPFSRRGSRRKRFDRDGGQWLALPMVVLQAKRFYALSPSATKLLFAICSQWMGLNNGDLCAAMSVLEQRGWRSTSTLARALAELLNAGFIAKTRLGGRNRCALYGLTWLPLGRAEKMDPELVRGFRRGAYLDPNYEPLAPVRAPAIRPGRRKFDASKSEVLTTELLRKVKRAESAPPVVLQKSKQSKSIARIAASKIEDLSRA
jgi:hypothetical protein